MIFILFDNSLESYIMYVHEIRIIRIYTHYTGVHSNKKEKWMNLSKDGCYFKIIIIISLLK